MDFPVAWRVVLTVLLLRLAWSAIGVFFGEVQHGWSRLRRVHRVYQGLGGPKRVLNHLELHLRSW